MFLPRIPIDMNAAFDTLAFANQLKAAGMPAKQSEAIASAVQEIAMAEVATKQHVSNEVREAVQKLTVRGFGAAVAIVSILAIIIKL